MIELSIVVCTHNPNLKYLRKVLISLQMQSLSQNKWELIIIDNASSQPLSEMLDLNWHPNSYLIRENKIGLTHARLHGITKARGEIIVFIDDDNLPDKNFLMEALAISKSYPFLGAWGGEIRPKFEIKPPTWLDPYLGLLAIRRVSTIKWSNLYSYETAPVGAGLCVRKKIAAHYAKKTKQNIEKTALDRAGSNFNSFGDYDLAFTACDLGYGIGQFPNLKISHIIPRSRMTIDYICKLREGITYSEQKFMRLRAFPPSPKLSLIRMLINQLKKTLLSRVHRQILEAHESGLKRFFKEQTT
jgi:glycosyltransferase involved in cell wall biosynthesis